MTTPTPHGAPELLPCPFCGKLFWTATKDPASTAAVIRCVSCGSQGAPKVTKEDARNAWNTRAAIQQAAGAVPEGWISVLDRLPVPDTGEVLVWVNTGYRAFDEWHTHHEDPTGLGGPTMPMGEMWGNFEFEDVTHWMKIPPPPASPSPLGREAGKEGSSDHLAACAGGGVTQPLTDERLLVSFLRNTTVFHQSDTPEWLYARDGDGNSASIRASEIVSAIRNIIKEHS